LNKESTAQTGEPKTNLTPGNHKHGFYVNGFIPCSECPDKQNCADIFKFKDSFGKGRCIREKQFFEDKYNEIEREFSLDKKDLFQLPQMLMIMIKLQRMNKYQADKGVVSNTILFNPKTGKEHMMDTPNVLNRDVFYAQKALMAWLDTLQMSRSSRKAKEGIDVLQEMFRK